MHEHEVSILKFLKGKGRMELKELADGTDINKDSVIWALENLSSIGAVKMDKRSTGSATLTKEGEQYLEAFPEEALVRSLVKSGSRAKLQGLNSIGVIWAKKNGWIEIQNGEAKLTEKGAAAAKAKDYQYRSVLKSIESGSDINGILSRNKEILSVLEKRNLVKAKESSAVSGIEITKKGIELSSEKAEQGIGALTREIIKGKLWQGKSFKSYDVNASSEQFYPARLHPMHEFNSLIRDAWFNMGFTEIEGPIVESAFWNFDALFSRQDHPTRDMQDTFFLSNPKSVSISDIELLNRVKKEHANAWKEEWREELAKQHVLRTHVTNVSAHYIRKFSKVEEGAFPVKLFSIGKVFRNEAIDYKHLAELTQTDGIIIGNNLSLANLIDSLKRFYLQLGIEDVKFKPSYFPFTEPSLEVYYYDKEHKDRIELAGAGIIRKEITRAMGIDKTVLAWGMGVERLLLHFLKVESLTELYKNDVGWLRNREEIRV